MSASEWTRQELRGAWDRVVDGLTKTAIATVRRKEAIWQVAAYLPGDKPQWQNYCHCETPGGPLAQEYKAKRWATRMARKLLMKTV